MGNKKKKKKSKMGKAGKKAVKKLQQNGPFAASLAALGGLASTVLADRAVRHRLEAIALKGIERLEAILHEPSLRDATGEHDLGDVRARSEEDEEREARNGVGPIEHA